MTPPRGLTSDEVRDREQRGAINLVPDGPSRSIPEIIKANTLTPVNMIMTTLLVLIFIAGKPGDALFAGVIVSNTVVGITQEIRAKRALDRLAVLSAPRARLLRDGEIVESPTDRVVLDDILRLEPGDQVVVDGVVIDADGLEIDESLLTGESDAIGKNQGDRVLSGSFVVAGQGHMRATHIGAEAYAVSLSEQARRFQLVNSELRNGINLLLRWLTWIIPPAAGLLAISLFSTEDRWQDALQGTVAAAVAMVPDGLVLLTSIAFVVGVLALARRNALAKELASVELLARVDVLCLDKTGTITTGRIVFGELDVLDDSDPSTTLADLVAADPSPNATLAAIGQVFDRPGGANVTDRVPFNSARKWSSTSFDDGSTWYLGAPDVLADDQAVTDRVADHAAQGRRVIALAVGDQPDADRLPPNIRPVALVLLDDELREDAAEILQYLVGQGIGLRVISGDHPATVAAVARRAGIPDADRWIDARELGEEPANLAGVMDDTIVFGRVSPHQKRSMVHALQAEGRVVAMTGDGVNDVLALKDADMGIAMGSGSSASRAVAELTLLDNRFATLPIALAEGRRVINNIERVANLFVVKATYAVLLAALTGLAGVPFPFLPRHLTLIGTFSIGLPGFILALAPETSRARPGFLRRVMVFSLPAGTIAAAATFGTYLWLRSSNETSLEQARTGATIVLLGLGLAVLAVMAHPLRRRHIVLIAAMVACYVVAMVTDVTREYFVLDSPPSTAWLIIALAIGGGALLLVGISALAPWSRPDLLEESNDSQ